MKNFEKRFSAINEICIAGISSPGYRPALLVPPKYIRLIHHPTKMVASLSRPVCGFLLVCILKMCNRVINFDWSVMTLSS